MEASVKFYLHEKHAPPRRPVTLRLTKSRPPLLRYLPLPRSGPMYTGSVSSLPVRRQHCREKKILISHDAGCWSEVPGPGAGVETGAARRSTTGAVGAGRLPNRLNCRRDGGRNTLDTIFQHYYAKVPALLTLAVLTLVECPGDGAVHGVSGESCHVAQKAVRGFQTISKEE